jgi:hypothetical protein
MSCGKWIALSIIACSYLHVLIRVLFEAPAHRGWFAKAGRQMVAGLNEVQPLGALRAAK